MSRLRELLDRGDKEGAIRWIDSLYDTDPDSPEATFYFAHLMQETDHPGPAKYILEHLTKQHPDKYQAWGVLGAVCESMDLYDKAEYALKRAIKLKPSLHEPYVGLSSIYTMQHKWAKARHYCGLALERGESLQAEINIAYIELANSNFGMGWDIYAKGVGHMVSRTKHNYGLPDWTGSSGRLLVYGEQGIGDNIAFCSAIPDILPQIAAINCHPKLQKLFSDSFGVPVYGDQDTEECHWIESTGATHQVIMSDLMRFLRRDKDSFPGKPFLKANPDKITQWKALLEQHCPGLKVGICWTGGNRYSHAWRRKNMDLSDLKALLQIPGIDWICLEYKDRSADLARIRNEDGLIIRDWPWGTQTSDYTDTAALISSLDCLVTVPTSVNHLAGGLGIETHCLVHERPHFHYMSGMPYYNSVHLHNRDKEGVANIRKILEEKRETTSHHPGRSWASGSGWESNAVGQDGYGIDYRPV